MLSQQIVGTTNQDCTIYHEGFLKDVVIKLLCEGNVGQREKKSQYSRGNEELCTKEQRSIDPY